MAITFVASTTAAPGPTGGTTSAIDTTGGESPRHQRFDLLHLASRSATRRAIPGCRSPDHASGTSYHRFWYCLSPTVGSGHTFTVACPVTSNYPAVLVYAFSGVASYQTESGTGGFSPLACGSVTPSANGALVLTGRTGAVASTDTVSSPAGFTATTVAYGAGVNMQGSAGYYVQPTAAAINPTWTWTGVNDGPVSAAVFLPAVVPNLTLLRDRQYTAPAAANAASITPNAVAWTNSAYVTLLDPTPAACVLTGVTVYTTHGSAATTSYDYEIDIATGAASSEVVIATMRGYNRRLSSGAQTGSTHCCVLPIPIDNIASGVRLSARLRKNNTDTTNTWKVAITYLQKPLASTTILTTAVVQKVIPPAAVGVTVTANATAWLDGAWVQLRAASGAALVLTGVVLGAPSTAAEYELDLGTGGSGSETVITTIRFNSASTGWPAFWMLPTPLDNVAASTRVAARLRCSLTASRTVVVSLMVLEKPL